MANDGDRISPWQALLLSPPQPAESVLRVVLSRLVNRAHDQQTLSRQGGVDVLIDLANSCPEVMLHAPMLEIIEIREGYIAPAHHRRVLIEPPPRLFKRLPPINVAVAERAVIARARPVEIRNVVRVIRQDMNRRQADTCPRRKRPTASRSRGPPGRPR